MPRVKQTSRARRCSYCLSLWHYASQCDKKRYDEAQKNISKSKTLQQVRTRLEGVMQRHEEANRGASTSIATTNGCPEGPFKLSNFIMEHPELCGIPRAEKKVETPPGTDCVQPTSQWRASQVSPRVPGCVVLSTSEQSPVTPQSEERAIHVPSRFKARKRSRPCAVCALPCAFLCMQCGINLCITHEDKVPGNETCWYKHHVRQ